MELEYKGFYLKLNRFDVANNCLLDEAWEKFCDEVMTRGFFSRRCETNACFVIGKNLMWDYAIECEGLEIYPLLCKVEAGEELEEEEEERLEEFYSLHTPLEFLGQHISCTMF